MSATLPTLTEIILNVVTPPYKAIFEWWNIVFKQIFHHIAAL